MSNEDPQAQPEIPPVPPAPPAPPAPPVPPVPQYGEYAAAQPTTPVPPAVPTPAPQYGYALPEYGAAGAAPVRKRRTWDLVLTIILLVVGLFGMGIGLLYAAIFTDPELVSESFSAQGYDWNGSAGSFSLVITVSHLLLYFAAVGISIPLLIKGRIVVFWIPLVAGVIAAVIFWVALFAVILSDPNFVNSVNSVS